MITLVSVLLSALTCFAQPRPLNPDERITPRMLLEFEDEPGHFLFVGQTPHQHNTFEIKHGKVTELPMIDWDAGAGTLDLKLAGPMRLLVPEDHPLAERGGRAYAIFPDRAREPLVRRDFDRAKLIALGLGHLLADETPPRPPREREVYDPLPLDGVMVLINSRNRDDLHSGFKERVATVVAAMATGCRVIEDGNRLYSGRQLVMCEPQRVADLVTALDATGTMDVLVANDGAELFRLVPPSTPDAVRILESKDASIAQDFGALVHLADHAAEWGDKFDETEFADLPFGILVGLRGIDQYIVALVRQIQADVRVANDLDWRASEVSIAGEVHAHPLYRRLVGPMMQTYLHVLQGLRAVDRPVFTRLILMTVTGAEGVAMQMLGWPITTSAPNVTFADAWLDWHLKHVHELSKLPTWPDPNATEKWRIHARSGGVFQNLGLNAHLVSPRLPTKARTNTMFEQIERLPFAPAVELGQVRDHRALKKKIVNFVITADQIAGRELPRLNDGLDFVRFAGPIVAGRDAEQWRLLRKYWDNFKLQADEYAQIRLPEYLKSEKQTTAEILASMRRHGGKEDTPYTGSGIVFDVVEKLKWPEPYVFDLQPGYNRETYFANVIDIVVTLLEDADEVLMTETTYLQLIDLGLYLQKQPAQTDELRDKQRELGRVMQARLTLPLALAQGKAECDFLLAPDPYRLKTRR